jgi:type IV secretion system protein VirB9
MTILTNKRAYHFDIESKLMSYSVDEELVYVVRFFFPSENFDLAKPMMNAGNFTMPVNEVQSFNFDYTISGPEKYAPTKIFDDGTNTFFKLPLGVGLPKFESSADDGGEVLMPRQKGEYIIVDKISPSFKLTYGDAVIYVFNEKVMGGR